MPRDSSPIDKRDTAVTEYLPRVGQFDNELKDKVDDLANERNAAARAIRQTAPPTLDVLQQILDGLRRL
jgi:hypothetical protein